MSSSLARRAFVALIVFTVPLSAQVHPGAIVRVRAPSVWPGNFEGTYLGRNADTLLFSNEEHGAFKVPAPAVMQIEVSTGLSRVRGAGRGALWGAAAGGALGLLAVSTASGEFTDPGAWVAMSAVGGAEIGTIVGLFVRKRVWTRAQPTWFTNAARMGPHMIGVQFAARYTR